MSITHARPGDIRPEPAVAAQRTPRHHGRRVARAVSRLIAWLLTGLFVVVVGPAVAFVSMMAAAIYLPLPGYLPDAKPPELSQPSQVFDSAGRQIGEFRVFESSVPMRPEDVPRVLKDAVVAAEDRNFYRHGGVDPIGVARALAVDIREGAASQGGSTITQQYVKNTVLGGERTLDRKIKEAILAGRADRTFTKDEILFRYLQIIYLGEGAYGAAAAAESYFHKPLQELTVSEAALLAGLIPAPSEWSPRVDPTAAEIRRTQVLGQMLSTATITADEYWAALNQPVWLATDGPAPGPSTVIQPEPQVFDSPYPYFVDYVRRWLIDHYGESRVYRGGLRVQATIDLDMQAAAEAEVARTLRNNPTSLEMSLVSVEPRTGFVKALVGGRDFNAPGGQVNLALGTYGGGSGRQPGSSFKPFVLAKAFSEGISPDAVYSGAPFVTNNGEVIQNYGGAVYGPMTLRQATTVSANTVFVRLMEDLGVQSTMEYARSLGVTSAPSYNPEVHGLSVALGALDVSPLDMASAFAVFGGRGLHPDPTPVAKVSDSTGVIDDLGAAEAKRVMDESVADNVNAVLSTVLTEGTAAGRGINRPAAGKTGTTSNNNDAWFVGYTPALSTAVWLGYRDERRVLAGINGVGAVTGGTIPAATWQAYMSRALAKVEPTGFVAPKPILPKAKPTTTTTIGNRPARRASVLSLFPPTPPVEALLGPAPPPPQSVDVAPPPQPPPATTVPATTVPATTVPATTPPTLPPTTATTVAPTTTVPPTTTPPTLPPTTATTVAPTTTTTTTGPPPPTTTTGSTFPATTVKP